MTAHNSLFRSTTGRAGQALPGSDLQEGRASLSLIRTVLAANAGDLDNLSELLARAFHEGPMLKWIIQRESGRHDALVRYFRGVLQASLDADRIYTTDHMVGIAIWTEPGTASRSRFLSSVARLSGAWRMLQAAGPQRYRRVTLALKQVREEYGTMADLHLSLLAVDPTAQRTGVGTALLEPMLVEADRLGQTINLDTGNESNVPFYEKHGFKVTRRLVVPHGCPDLWLMWRDPAQTEERKAPAPAQPEI